MFELTFINIFNKVQSIYLKYPKTNGIIICYKLFQYLDTYIFRKSILTEAF